MLRKHRDFYNITIRGYFFLNVRTNALMRFSMMFLLWLVMLSA